MLMRYLRQILIRLLFLIVIVMCFIALFYSKDLASKLLLSGFASFFLIFLLLDLFGPWLWSLEYFSRLTDQTWTKIDRITFLTFCMMICGGMLILVYELDYPLVLKVFLYCVSGVGVIYIPRMIYLIWKNRGIGRD